MKIITFPPVRYTASRWGEVGDVQSGRGFFNGTRFASAFGPVRVSASVTVSALANARSGAGYMEMLKRQMRHGVDYLRLNSPPINWHLDHTRNSDLRTTPLAWADGGAPLGWVDGVNPLSWFDGAVYLGTPGTDAKGFDIVTITGLPANRLVVRPADVLRSHPAGAASVTARAITEAYSNGSGVAVVRVESALPNGVISLGDFESRVFVLDGGFPSSDQPVQGNWFYPLNLIEVLPTEYAGATEIDPWT